MEAIWAMPMEKEGRGEAEEDHAVVFSVTYSYCHRQENY